MILPLLVFLFGALLVIIYLDARRTIPYVYCNAMISAWMGKMLSPEKILELCEKDLSETPELLSGTDFEEVSHRPLEEMELLVREKCAKRYREILENLPPKALKFYKILMERFELFNLKAILIYVTTGTPPRFLPSPLSTPERWKLLMNAKNLQELVEFLKGTDYGNILADMLKRGENLHGIIRRLEHHYFTKLWSEARKQRKAVRELVGVEIDILNLKILFRSKATKTRPEDLEKLLIRPSYLLPESVLDSAIMVEDLSSLVQVLSRTVYGEAITRAYQMVQATHSLYPIEKELEEGFLRMCKWYLTADFFSLTPPVCFFYLKEAEVRNFRTAIRLRTFGFKPQECKEEVIRYGL